MKDLFAQKKRERCPQCLRISLERDQTSGRICRHPLCGWTGSREDGQAKWDQLKALRDTLDQKTGEAAKPDRETGTHEPSKEPPRFDFKPKLGESPRERQLAKRRMVELLQKKGIRVPHGMGMSDNAAILTDEEIAQRSPRSTQLSDEERQRELRYHQALARAGIGSTGIVIKGS